MSTEGKTMIALTASEIRLLMSALESHEDKLQDGDLTAEDRRELFRAMELRHRLESTPHE